MCAVATDPGRPYVQNCSRGVALKVSQKTHLFATDLGEIVS